MELLIGQYMDKGDSSSSCAMMAISGASAAMEEKNFSGSTVLSKDQRIEKGRFMNRVANMNPERRLKKLMSDRYENMSEERRMKKKESNRILNRPENMTLERKMKKKLSDSAAHMSAERKEKKREAQRKRNLNKAKAPRVPLSLEKRDMKNEKGKLRRAAKKAAGQTDTPSEGVEDLGLDLLPPVSFLSSSLTADGGYPVLVLDGGPIEDRDGDVERQGVIGSGNMNDSDSECDDESSTNVAVTASDVSCNISTQDPTQDPTPTVVVPTSSACGASLNISSHASAEIPVEDDTESATFRPDLVPLPYNLECLMPSDGGIDAENSSSSTLLRKRSRTMKDK